MFEKLAAPDDVIAMRLSGKLTGKDVEQYKALFDEKLAKYKQVGVCVDLTGFSDMSMEAIVKDAKVEFDLFLTSPSLAVVPVFRTRNGHRL